MSYDLTEADTLINWFDESGGFAQGTKAPYKWVLQVYSELMRLRAALAAAPAPQADSQPALPKITSEDRSFLNDNPNTDDVVKWVQDYARAAISADRAARKQGGAT